MSACTNTQIGASVCYENELLDFNLGGKRVRDKQRAARQILWQADNNAGANQQYR